MLDNFEINTEGAQRKNLFNEQKTELTPILCTDSAYECENLRNRGYCRNLRYKKLMIYHCKATCKFCSDDI